MHWKILAVKFAFVIIFEHVVFGVCKLIDILVPDIPASLDIKIKRERYLAKEALQVSRSDMGAMFDKHFTTQCCTYTMLGFSLFKAPTDNFMLIKRHN